MGVMEAAGAFFRSVAEGLGLVRQKDAELNTADMKSAAQKQDEVTAQSITEKAVQSGDVEQIRKDLSE